MAATPARSQDATDAAVDPDKPAVEVEVADKVEVVPENTDGRISARLYDIMLATEWFQNHDVDVNEGCLLYTSPSPRDATLSRMPSSA